MAGLPVSLPTPTFANHTFTGWNTASNGSGTNYTSISLFSMPSGDTTLYAQWAVNVTLTFDPQGGTVSPTSYTGTASQPLNATIYPMPTRTGYTFLHWNAASDGSGTSYGAFSFITMPATDETLYAIWQAPTPTLSYNTEGGTKDEILEDAQHTAGGTVTLGGLGTTVRTGYTFAGWNTASDGSGTMYAAGSSFTMPSGNTTLYAIWHSTANVPNGGDVNGDGIADNTQTNVGSFTDSVSNQYAAVAVSDSACSLSGVNAAASSVTGADGSYTYPMGLMNFSVTCGTSGFTTTVKQYFYNPPSGNFVLRKYINGKYQTVSGATISRTTIGGQPVLVVSYEVTDGGPLDADGTANGVIVDPAGPALTDDSTLSNTGENLILITSLAGTLIAVTIGIRLYASKVRN
jgi:uncharacterized repeat protein (TIGR02543 family)